MAALRITHLSDALADASATCFTDTARRAVIYCTTRDGVADSLSGERYLVFRSDDTARHHLRDDQGWREIYTIEASK